MSNDTRIQITDETLKQAAADGMDAFLQAIVDKYLEAIQGRLDADTMALLNGSQHTLLGYHILRRELMDGGFVQLIQNGYGPYIFENPFAKAMKLYGLPELSKLIYRAHDIYAANKADLTKERSDDDFMAMYEQYAGFDDLEEAFIEEEEDFTSRLAVYVDEHLDDFITVISTND